MKIVVGLGNPGKTYVYTRHNVGALFLEHFAGLYKLELARKHSMVLWEEADIEGIPVVLARPRSYMNDSGEAVAYLVHHFSASPHDLIVVNDDMDLPLGKIRIRARGSSGGHKGIESIIDNINSQEFTRMRIGIGRPPKGVDEVPYVLGAFTDGEMEVVRQVMEKASKALVRILTQGVDAAMTQFN